MSDFNIDVTAMAVLAAVLPYAQVVAYGGVSVFAGIFDAAESLLSDIRKLILLLLALVTAGLAVSAFVTTRSTSKVLGVCAVGVLALAVLLNFTWLAESTGEEIVTRAGVTSTGEFGDGS